MAENPFFQSDTDGPAGIQLTETEYADLVTELETLRASHRAELAERLRNARDFGPAAENDDLHAVLEDAAIDRARIAQLEEPCASPRSSSIRTRLMEPRASAPASSSRTSTVRRHATR